MDRDCDSCRHFNRKIALDHPKDDLGNCRVQLGEKGGRIWTRADETCERWEQAEGKS